MKTIFVLQLIESGYQKLFGLSCQMYFLLCDPEVYDFWFKSCGEVAQALHNCMPPSIKRGDVILHQIASWKPSGSDHCLSSKAVVNEAIIGKDK